MTFDRFISEWRRKNMRVGMKLRADEQQVQDSKSMRHTFKWCAVLVIMLVVLLCVVDLFGT